MLGQLGNVIAPVLLPLFSLLTMVFDSPAPVMEWDVVEQTATSCSIDLNLAVMSDAELSKLSLVPHAASSHLSLSTSHLPSDDHWLSDNVWSWMWYGAPKTIKMNMKMDWDPLLASSDDGLIDVTWEHVVDGQRAQWTLGTVRLPEPMAPEMPASNQSEAHGKRVAAVLDESQATVSLEMDHVPGRCLCEVDRVYPRGCACDVIDGAGASLQTMNTQIFLWFQTESAAPLRPKYTLRCGHALQSLPLEGILEVAFGTETKTTDIGQTVWMESDSLLNETMRLTQPSDRQSDASALAATGQRGSGLASPSDVAFAIFWRITGPHPQEWVDDFGFQGQTYTIRHEGWHKHLTNEVRTYSRADDAF